VGYSYDSGRSYSQGFAEDFEAELDGEAGEGVELSEVVIRERSGGEGGWFWIGLGRLEGLLVVFAVIFGDGVKQWEVG
jgi:hypothetical protein